MKNIQKTWLIKLGAQGPLIAATETRGGWTKPATIIQQEDGTFQLTGFVDLVNHHGYFEFPEVLFKGEPTTQVEEAYEKFFAEVLPEPEE